jgi:quercetin dioxygenase-like cupin family protein
MTDQPYTYLANINAAGEPPAAGILSRTVYQDDFVKVVYFGFAPGEELSEHTASMPAIVHIVEGTGQLTVGADSYAVGPGAWVHMTARLPHSLQAETPLIMVLTMLKGAAA